jgi:hypothetical protein
MGVDGPIKRTIQSVAKSDVTMGSLRTTNNAWVVLRIAALALLQALVLMWVPASGANNHAPPRIARIGSSEKICQLIGDVDWETGKPTQAMTFTNYGLDAADLGYPVDLGDKLVLLFGDSWPPGHPPGSAPVLPPDDSVGVTTLRNPPTKDRCLQLKINDTGSSPEHFAPATIIHTPAVKQGFFNVPSGGVAVAGELYAFFWTNHCVEPNALIPSPSDPLALPAVNRTHRCPETPTDNSLGVGVMASSADEGRTFHNVVTMPTGFVYTTAVNAMHQADIPAEQRLGVFIFSAARYRASVPYLAYAPVATLADPSTWRFFTGRDTSGKPKWVTLAEWNGTAMQAKSLRSNAWAPPGDAEVFTPDSDQQRCIGEMSVTWNKPLHAWLMLYQCSGVQARVAAAPWGPWSEPTELLGQGDNPGCRLVMIPQGCGNRRDYWPAKHPNGQFTRGGFYAPYVLNRYTTDAGSTAQKHKATIYWTLSTWNPYVVSIMRTTIESAASSISPNEPTGR